MRQHEPIGPATNWADITALCWWSATDLQEKCRRNAFSILYLSVISLMWYRNFSCFLFITTDSAQRCDLSSESQSWCNLISKHATRNNLSRELFSSGDLNREKLRQIRNCGSRARTRGWLLARAHAPRQVRLNIKQKGRGVLWKSWKTRK